MSGARGDALVEGSILARLAAEPAGVVDLLAAARDGAAHALSGQEGAFHAILHRLVRTGRVEPIGHGEDGGTVYAVKGAPPPAVAPTVGLDAPPFADARDARAATRIASGARTPSDRGRIAADVLAHLASLGPDRRDDLGRVGHAKASVRRVDRGRAAVCAPMDGADRLRAFLAHDGPSLLVTAAGLGIVWGFVAEPRRIPTHSMEPTLSPGDRVIVRKLYGKEMPRRHDVVVFRTPRGTDPLVKRAVGLGGERIQIDDVTGDVFIDEKRLVKPEALREALREPLPISDPDTPAGRGEWESTTCGRRRFTRRLFADDPVYRDEEGHPEYRPAPRHDAHDVELEADVESTDADGGAGLFLEWVDQSDEPANPPAGVGLVVAPGGVVCGTLGHKGCGFEKVAARGGGVPAGRTVRVSIAYVDGVFHAKGAGLDVAAPIDGLWRGRARVLVAGKVSGLRAWRDIHYTRDGRFAGANDYVVPPGFVFFLGDHSSNSHDSRFDDVGPIPLRDLVGPVVFRVWPPNRVGRVP